MRISTIMMLTMLSMIPHVSFTQEQPDTTEQQTTPTEVETPAETEQPTDQAATVPEENNSAVAEPEIKEDASEKAIEAMPSDEMIQESITTTQTPSESSVTQTIEEMPEPVEEEPIVIPDTEEEGKPQGIDTVSLDNPQGNWLFKRIWWERAEERYEKIRLLVDAVWESRTIFFVKRNELDRNVLDPFYLNVGIGQGELQTILAEQLDFFEKHREQQGDLTEQERSLYESIENEEEALKQLKLDVDAIASLDHAIDDALGTLMNQINRVRQFERQAWDNFKEIAHILNDTKARELYYMIEGAARNIKNISTYLERDFFNHFTHLINEATKHVTRVQNQIEALKEKGVNFKRQTELLEQKNEQQMEEEEEEEVTPKPKVGWFGWIGSFFKNIFNTIFSVIRIPYDMIFGK
ncbi:MAG TPA: hypothetical protein VKU36_00370 [Candidatus Babeliales bacterium]|nr:hypothetical protein [Candidatus Babeliales bacterium]